MNEEEIQKLVTEMVASKIKDYDEIIKSQAKRLIEQGEELRKLKFESASGAGGNNAPKFAKEDLKAALHLKLEATSLADVVKEVAASSGMTAEQFFAHERTHDGRRGD
jgi:hypothetical protein